MIGAKELLGLHDVSREDRELLKFKQVQLGMPTDIDSQRQMLHKLAMLEDQYEQRCIELYGRPIEEKSVLVGARLGLLVMQVMQRTKEPDTAYLSGHEVPRPFIFDRELAPLAGFDFILRSCVPNAAGLRFSDAGLNSIDAVRHAETILPTIESTNDPVQTLYLVPSALDYISNARKQQLMFVLDTGDLAPEVYEYFSTDSVV